MLVYCVPIGLVIYISDKEVKSYNEDIDFKFEKVAYGEPVKLEKKDVYEYYEVDMKVTCSNIHELTLSSEAEVSCEIGTEIHKGDDIAVENGKSIKAEFNGIILDFEYGNNNTVKYYDFSDLALEVYFDQDKYDILNNKSFQNENGEKFKIITKSNIIEEGKFKLILTIPKGFEAVYGMNIEDYRLYTGVIYKNTLVARRDCVYGNNGNYYISVVDENGLFIEEVEVALGFTDDIYVCVSSSQIDENTYCDSGYAIANEEISEEDIY